MVFSLQRRDDFVLESDVVQILLFDLLQHALVEDDDFIAQIQRQLHDMGGKNDDVLAFDAAQ